MESELTVGVVELGWISTPKPVLAAPPTSPISVVLKLAPQLAVLGKLVGIALGVLSKSTPRSLTKSTIGEVGV